MAKAPALPFASRKKRSTRTLRVLDRVDFESYREALPPGPKAWLAASGFRPLGGRGQAAMPTMSAPRGSALLLVHVGVDALAGACAEHGLFEGAGLGGQPLVADDGPGHVDERPDGPDGHGAMARHLSGDLNLLTGTCPRGLVRPPRQ